MVASVVFGVCITPFGSPVVPEVKTTSCTRLGSLPGSVWLPARVSQAGAFRFSELRHKAGIPLHTHSSATITILLGGAYGESYPGGQRCGAPRGTEFTPASVLFRAGDVAHENWVGAEGAHSLVVEVGSARLDELREYTRVFDGVTHRQDALLEAVARCMQREVARPDTAALLALEGLTLELLALASRRSVPGDGARTKWLARARDMLHDQFGDHMLRIGDLAAAVGVHPVHLARAFRTHFGVTPGAYLRRVRVDWAARELVTTSRAVSEIALAAGFADQSHFTRVFRAEIGATPGQWRTLRGTRGLGGTPRVPT